MSPRQATQPQHKKRQIKYPPPTRSFDLFSRPARPARPRPICPVSLSVKTAPVLVVFDTNWLIHNLADTKCRVKDIAGRHKDTSVLIAKEVLRELDRLKTRGRDEATRSSVSVFCFCGGRVHALLWLSQAVAVFWLAGVAAGGWRSWFRGVG